MNNIAPLGGQRGVSIYLSVLILSFILSIALGISAIFITQIKEVIRIGDSVTAFFAADSGIERVLWEDNTCWAKTPPCFSPCNSNCAGLQDGAVFNYSFDTDYNYTVQSGVNSFKSIGIYKGTRRAIGISR